MTTSTLPIPSIVYVDGFNLYYGAVRNTPYKWLDIGRLVELLLPAHKILKIKYFTALVKPRPQDPGQPQRQHMYLRALRTLPNLQIILGHFLSHEVLMPKAGCSPGKQEFVRVIKTEEKGSDVNIATHLLWDGFKNSYEAGVIISNDSDLVEAITIVRTELKKRVVILNPFPKTRSHELMRVASMVKPIRQGALSSSQFPPELQDENGVFSRPTGW